MEENYRSAFSEVLHVLNRLDIKVKKKIPRKFIKFLYENKSDSYNKKMPTRGKLDKIDLSEEAKAILYVVNNRWLKQR